MTIKNLKVLSKRGPLDIPDWINFAFELGAYINDHGIKYKKSINLILSLPSEQFFSLFIAMGIADKTYSKTKQMRSIRKAVMNLEKGSRIIYKDDQSARKASVISVEPSPVFENEMILKIKDGKMDRGIPERYWIDRVILLDEEFDEIKRTRKVSKKQKVGLDNSRLLRVLYTSGQLNKVEFYPGDSFYLVGNIGQINENMSKDIFIYEGVKGTIKDFLYFDNSNSYTNGKLFSSQMKKIDVDVNKEVPVIYSDLYSFIKQDKHFTTNPKIILSSRTDHENRLHEVKEELKRELLQDDHKVVTEEIINYLKSTDTQIPLGVEFLAWR
ncbi:hypothetical protein KGF86_01795 [Ornithinibacillus massiliensis]|uniref:Uncharacterized protein n=1 Tax=Ornithinibacillus massiliensis TaxID=1944633 RepID=A0ABS5M9Y6_9BACI|nr:hypothetical protein [Ornithinibacillus massiliensis]MBS3678937.1 hypothetical protein [Ornithinibacillus massiliensis]